MWWGVRDPSQLLRESTVEALREVLSLLSDRSSKARGRWIVAVYTETMRGFEACGGDPAAAPNRHVAPQHAHTDIMKEGPCGCSIPTFYIVKAFDIPLQGKGPRF